MSNSQLPLRLLMSLSLDESAELCESLDALGDAPPDPDISMEVEHQPLESYGPRALVWMSAAGQLSYLLAKIHHPELLAISDVKIHIRDRDNARLWSTVIDQKRHNDPGAGGSVSTKPYAARGRTEVLAYGKLTTEHLLGQNGSSHPVEHRPRSGTGSQRHHRSVSDEAAGRTEQHRSL